MAKVKLVGKQIVSYTKKQTGELKEGISLFVTSPKEGVQGECADSIWVKKGSELYDRMLALDASKPVMIEVISETPLGGRYSVLVDIKVMA